MSPTSSSVPLLAFERARWSARGSPTLPEWNATVTGRRVALLGDWSFFFRFLAGERVLGSGRVQLVGLSADQAVRRGVVGLCLRSVALPAAWSVARYLAQSAALLGRYGKAGKALAAQALQRFNLEALSLRRLGTLSEPERRGVCLAQALLADPAVLCCEAPLARLPSAAADYVEALLERAAEGRALIVSLTTSSPWGGERSQLEHADAALQTADGALLENTLPSIWLGGGSSVLATVTRQARAFVDALRARGLSSRELASPAVLQSSFPGNTEFELARFLITLKSPGETAPVVQAALEASAPLVELFAFET